MGGDGRGVGGAGGGGGAGGDAPGGGALVVVVVAVAHPPTHPPNHQPAHRPAYPHNKSSIATNWSNIHHYTSHTDLCWLMECECMVVGGGVGSVGGWGGAGVRAGVMVEAGERAAGRPG